MIDMYRDHLLDHARQPRQYGVLAQATCVHRETNPSCGDEISIYLIINPAGLIEKASFTGQGCVISQAATSILLENVIGQSVREVLTICSEDVVGLLGIRPGPMRMNCALIPLRALYKALC